MSSVTLTRCAVQVLDLGARTSLAWDRRLWSTITCRRTTCTPTCLAGKASSSPAPTCRQPTYIVPTTAGISTSGPVRVSPPHAAFLTCRLRGFLSATLPFFCNVSCLQPPYTVPYRTVPYRTVPYRTLPYPTLPYPTLPYPTLPYPTLPYHTIPYHTIPYHTILYYTILYYTILYYTIQYFKSSLSGQLHCRLDGHCVKNV